MITSAQYAITDTRTKIVPTGVGHRTAHLASIGNTTVYLGNSTVTSSTGYAYGKALDWAGPVPTTPNLEARSTC